MSKATWTSIMTRTQLSSSERANGPRRVSDKGRRENGKSERESEVEFQPTQKKKKAK